MNPNQSEDQYTYYPLPPIAPTGRTPPFSRLMTLYAGLLDEPLCCSLSTINVENAPPFEALSYTWGKEESRSFLYVDGGALPIKPNLEAALLHIRLPTQARRLWVDAICIDQSSSPERSRQVSYMRSVYQYAARVIVWIGTRTPGIEYAFQLAGRIAEGRRAIAVPNTFVRGEATHLGDVGAENSAAIVSALLEDCHPDSMERLVEVFDRQYFTRSWCIQEVFVASWAIAKCEDLEVPFLDILAASPDVKNIREEALHSFFVGKPLDFWNSMYVQRLDPDGTCGSKVKGSMGDLLTLLSSSRDFQATNPRDKIFALIGISDEGLEPVRAYTRMMTSKEPSYVKLLRSGITKVQTYVNSLEPGLDFGKPQVLIPDYDKEVAEVYRDTTRFMIRKSPRLLDVLNHVQHHEEPHPGAFPTWVPKWNEAIDSTVLGTGYFLAGFCDGHFPYFADVHDNPLTGHSNNPQVLSLDGFQVDTVRQVSHTMQFESLQSDSSMESVWKDLFSFPMRDGYTRRYNDGDLLIMAFYLIMTAGSFGPLHSSIASATTDTKIDAAKESTVIAHAKLEAKSNVAQFLVNLSSDHDTGDKNIVSLHTLATDGSTKRFIQQRASFSCNRRVFLTNSGWLGTGPKMMRPGDQVVVLFGGRTPFVLRRVSETQQIFVGQCYVHDDDIMWKKATENVKVKRTHGPIVTYNLV